MPKSEREPLHERFHGLPISKAGQKNCLRAVYLLAPAFLSQASSPSIVGCLLECSLMYGIDDFPDSNFAGHINQILCNLNLLSDLVLLPSNVTCNNIWEEFHRACENSAALAETNV